MPDKYAYKGPEPLSKRAVARGILWDTWQWALFSAVVYVVLYFILRVTFSDDPHFALGYALVTPILWGLVVTYRTLWIWIVAWRIGVPFRILWELVVKYRQRPAGQYWGPRGQNQDLIKRGIEAGRKQHSEGRSP